MLEVKFTKTEADRLREILTTEIAGHHNRLETAVLSGYSDEYKMACATAARDTRALRTAINRAEREQGEQS